MAVNEPVLAPAEFHDWDLRPPFPPQLSHRSPPADSVSGELGCLCEFPQCGCTTETLISYLKSLILFLHVCNVIIPCLASFRLGDSVKRDLGSHEP